MKSIFPLTDDDLLLLTDTDKTADHFTLQVYNPSFQMQAASFGIVVCRCCADQSIKAICCCITSSDYKLLCEHWQMMIIKNFPLPVW